MRTKTQRETGLGPRDSRNYVWPERFSKDTISAFELRAIGLMGIKHQAHKSPGGALISRLGTPNRALQNTSPSQQKDRNPLKINGEIRMLQRV